MKLIWQNPEYRESTVKNMQGKKRTEEQKLHYKEASERMIETRRRNQSAKQTNA